MKIIFFMEIKQTEERPYLEYPILLISVRNVAFNGEIEKSRFQEESGEFNWILSVKSNSNFHISIHNPCIPHKTIIRKNITTGVVIEEDAFLCPQ